MILKMTPILPIFLFCMIFMASADHVHEDVGEYGNYNSNRKHICEQGDPQLFEDLDACFKQENKNVQEATIECLIKALPSSKGETSAFLTTACEEPDYFIKFDKCFEEYEANPAFREQMVMSTAVEACYDNAMKKYKMDD